MSNFLDVLDKIELSDDCDNYQSVEQIILLRNSLGENAKRMLEIGIVQDKLVNLGFYLRKDVSNIGMFEYLSLHKYIFVIFYRDHFRINVDSFDYDSSSTWQQDLLTNVRELINE